MFTITRTWIKRHRTGNGAWTRAQLHAIGVAWPPRHGWIDRVIGHQISARERTIFETARRPLHAKPRAKHQLPYHVYAPAFMQTWNDK